MTSQERDPQEPSKTAMRQVAAEWTPLTPDSYGKPGSYEAYGTLADTFLDRVRAKLPDHGSKQLISGTAANGGAHVVSRFFYVGATHAARRHFSQEQLKNALYKPGSFTDLQLLTREWNRSARRIEYETGLAGPLYAQDNRIEENFTLDHEEGLRFTQYLRLQYIARSELVDNGDSGVSVHEAYDKTSTIRCIGHSAGLLTYLYRHMLTVADADPSLFKATLAGAAARAE